MEQASRFYKQPKMKQKEYLEMIQRLFETDYHRDAHLIQSKEMQRRALTFPRNAVSNRSRSPNSNLVINRDGASIKNYSSVSSYHTKKRSYLFDQRLIGNGSFHNGVTKTVRQRPIHGHNQEPHANKHPRSILKNRMTTSYSAISSSPSVVKAYNEENNSPPQHYFSNTISSQNYLKKTRNVKFDSIPESSNDSSTLIIFEEESGSDLGTLLSTRLSEIEIKNNQRDDDDILKKKHTQLNHEVNAVHVNGLNIPTYLAENDSQLAKKLESFNKSYMNEDFFY